MAAAQRAEPQRPASLAPGLGRFDNSRAAFTRARGMGSSVQTDHAPKAAMFRSHLRPSSMITVRRRRPSHGFTVVLPVLRLRSGMSQQVPPFSAKVDDDVLPAIKTLRVSPFPEGHKSLPYRCEKVAVARLRLCGSSSGLFGLVVIVQGRPVEDVGEASVECSAGFAGHRSAHTRTDPGTWPICGASLQPSKTTKHKPRVRG